MLPIDAVRRVLEEVGDARDHGFSIDYTHSAAFVHLTECVFEALVRKDLLDGSAHARTAEFVRLRKGGQHISSLAVTGFKHATSASRVAGHHTTEHLHALGVVQVSLRGGRWWRTRRRTPEEDGGSVRATRLWRDGPDELGVPGTFREFQASTKRGRRTAPWRSRRTSSRSRSCPWSCLRPWIASSTGARSRRPRSRTRT
mmetsp:Transcript_28541/g.88328  ORF Transcript_28541/g.88328 Transcript_28541/m.88328 type:complete len:200 (+) Transcript_28541:68-667(+)